MKRHSWYRTLIALWLVMLVSSTGGCITITAPEEPAQPSTAPEESSPPSTTPEPSGRRPDINYFTATPETISLGESVSLSWEVSNATTVTIQPSVGGVAPSGSQQLSPQRDTTYTLTASNAAGDMSSSLTVRVTPAVFGKPDLVVTDVWFTAGIVYYTIKNLGDAEAKASRSDLYIHGILKDDDYVEKLAPGEETTESFSSYAFQYDPSYPVITGGAVEKMDLPETPIKVCADGKNAIAERNEGNNCGSHSPGFIFEYDFVEKAHQATWRSGAGELKWPMVASDTKGAAFYGHGALEDGKSYANTLATYPQQVSYGSIQGTYGEFYSDPDSWQPLSRELTIPENSRFTTMVGFKKGATATDGATVAFGYTDPLGSIVLFREMTVYCDGVLDIYEVDLSGIAGEEVYFILRVEAGASWEQDWLVWVDPKVIQER